MPQTTAPAPSLTGRILGALLLVALLGGAVGAYVYVGRESSLAGALPLPAALRTTSEAHEDLLLVGRALNEIAVDTEGRLLRPTRANAQAAVALQNRLTRWHRTSSELEPRLTREETRALVALQQGEKLLKQFVASSTGGGPFDPGLLRAARSQIGHGQELARGKDLGALVTSSAVKALSSGRSAPASALQGGFLTGE